MNEKKTKRISKRWIIRIAAAVLVLILAGVGVGLYAKFTKQVAVRGKITIKTGIGGVGVFEHRPTESNGIYSVSNTADEITDFTYDLVPGVNAPCDAFVRVEGKTELPSWLIIEIVNPTANVALPVDDSSWTEISGVTGQNGGALYVYKDVLVKADGNIAENGSCEIPVLSGNTITVPDTLNPSADANKTIAVHGFLIQKMTDSAGVDANWILNSNAPAPEDAPGVDTSAVPLAATCSALANTITVRTASGIVPSANVGENNSVSFTVPSRTYPVFVRAAYTVNWVNDAGEIYGSAPVEGIDYSVTGPAADSGWFQKDGFWYYSPAINASDSAATTAALIQSVTEYNRPPEGYTLKVQTATQVIQAIGMTGSPAQAIVTAAWGVVYHADTLTVSAS